MAFYLIATLCVSLVLVARLKERVLYLLFAWAYVQNVVLAGLYTSGLAGANLCRALLFPKEIVLLLLFFIFFPNLRRHGRGHWPTPLYILGLFTVWCIVRYTAAVIFQGESLIENLWNLREVCFPFEFCSRHRGSSDQA